jgi:hypothetical protein
LDRVNASFENYSTNTLRCRNVGNAKNLWLHGKCGPSSYINNIGITGFSGDAYSVLLLIDVEGTHPLEVSSQQTLEGCQHRHAHSFTMDIGKEI